METYLRFIKPPHGSAEWLKSRWIDDSGDKRLSASNAAAIYNQHPFMSEAQLAAELLSDCPPQPVEANAAMDRGNRLEDTLIKWASDKTGIEFITPDLMFSYKNSEGANLVATLDGFNEETGCVLEIKTTTKEFDTLPAHWYFQGVQQAICAETDVVVWGIFDRNQDLIIHEQFVSSDEKRSHIEAAAQWLSFINMGIAPDHIQWDYATISKRFPVPTVDSIEVGPAAYDVFQRLRHAKSEQKSYIALVDSLQAELAEFIGDAAQATYNGEVIYTWKSQTRTSFDQKTFKAAYPDLAREFTKDTSIRVMRMKGEK